VTGVPFNQPDLCSWRGKPVLIGANGYSNYPGIEVVQVSTSAAFGGTSASTTVIYQPPGGIYIDLSTSFGLGAGSAAVPLLLGNSNATQETVALTYTGQVIPNDGAPGRTGYRFQGVLQFTHAYNEPVATAPFTIPLVTPTLYDHGGGDSVSPTLSAVHAVMGYTTTDGIGDSATSAAVGNVITAAAASQPWLPVWDESLWAVGGVIAPVQETTTGKLAPTGWGTNTILTSGPLPRPGTTGGQALSVFASDLVVNGAAASSGDLLDLRKNGVLAAGHDQGGNLTLNGLNAPGAGYSATFGSGGSALTATASTSGGTLADNTLFTYTVTFVSSAGGETVAGASGGATTGTSGGHNSISLSGIPLGPGDTVARNLYRNGYFLHQLADNSTTGYQDTGAATTSQTPPSVTGAVPRISLVPPAGNAIRLAYGQLGTNPALTISGAPVLVPGVAVAPLTMSSGSSYSMAASDQRAVLITVSTGFTLTLPSPASVGAGAYIWAKAAFGSGTAVTVNASGANVDGGASVSIPALGHLWFYCDGSNWWTA
jgi:hypothetical protein